MIPAVISFSAAGADLAARVAAALDGRVHHCGAGGDNAKTLMPRLFEEKTPIVGICAAGILIRLLAPLLDDKREEPPVLAVSLDGKSVVPLLGGHHGANRLAVKLAASLDAHAAITTASDSQFSRGLDDPPPGWELSKGNDAKPAMMSLLVGAKLALEGHAPWIAEAGYPVSSMGQMKVLVTEQKVKVEHGLVYHPKTLVAGVGCERHTDPAEVVELIEIALARENLSPQSLVAIASVDIKADERALHVAAAHFKVPLRLFSVPELNQERYRLTSPSAVVEAEIGTPSVAEAAALKAGMIAVPKLKSKRATCAIGRSIRPIDPTTLGRAPGLLHIVGIGPGDAATRTISAVRALDASTDWVGYGLYLDLIANLRIAQAEHRFQLGDEEARVRHALELAATGKVVSLVCSGDGQIYAMAALVYELLEQRGERAVSEGARRVALEAHPGISAFQAASAAAGALVGHDFCCISLSDLLTPRDDILRRLDAAGKGDFVTALYNPRSARRNDLIVEAKNRLLLHRGPDTPVIVASSLGRAEEKVKVVTLADFDPQDADMMTIVLVGASGSKSFARGDGRVVTYTPRGYASKAVAGSAATDGPSVTVPPVDKPHADMAVPPSTVPATPTEQSASAPSAAAPTAPLNTAAIKAGIRFLRERARASGATPADTSAPAAGKDDPRSSS